MPAGTVGTYMKHLMQGLSIAAGLMVAVMAAVAFVFARALTRPLEQMSAAAKGLAQGDFSRRIAVSRQDEIGQLAMAFNDMSASLEAGEKMRRGFVANVSHELKSPMTTIGGFVDGMLDGTIPPELHHRYLAVVSEEVKRLSRLVNRMLDLSRLESGEITLHPAPVDLTKLVLQSVLLCESQLNEREISVSGLDELPQLSVTADPDLMEQVVRNLLDNGVKYTPVGGEITLGGEATEDTVRLWIRNTCEGIDEEHLPFVFDRFFKADASRGADQQSLGLGLYLVKTILSLHGGLVTVRSVKDAYCEFEIVMPSRKGE
jgi:signal transduction histidine kinase